MALSFDDEREENIRRNRERLRELGLDFDLKELLPKKAKPPPKRKQPSNRKAPTPPTPTSDDEDKSEDATEGPPTKVPRSDSEPTGLRRSSRVVASGKVVNYAGDGDQLEVRRGPRIVSDAARKGLMSLEPKLATQRTQDPKRYGAIPGVPVGTWWESRAGCSKDAVHAPLVAGITVGPDGAYSVALSGGYEDDVDVGEGFTYTGSGGRDLKGTKENPKNLRTAPQSCDQTWDNAYNSALKRSVESKKPVRVIRGYKLPSVFAPAEGYRYDGLYTVEKAWQERGLNPKRYFVCKFLFKRIPGQPPLPRCDKEDDATSDEGENGKEPEEQGESSGEAQEAKTSKRKRSRKA